MIDFDTKKVVAMYVLGDEETTNRCGASGMFQVVSILLEMEDGSEIDVAENIDQGLFFSKESKSESLKKIAELLKLDISPENMDYEQIT